jgi:hypothetical protein
MKENAIRKINEIGKIGNIITIIAKVCVIIGMVGCILGGIFFLVIPKDFIRVQMSGNAMVEINLDELNIPTTRIKVADKNYNKYFNLNGLSYNVDDIDTNDGNMTINASTNTYELNLKHLAGLMAMVIVYLSLVLVVLFFVGFLCKAVRNCASPFETNVIEKMRNLAIAMIPWAVGSSFSHSIFQSIFNGSVNIVQPVDLKIVLTVVLFFGLVYIFKYGAILQQESDETL